MRWRVLAVLTLLSPVPALPAAAQEAVAAAPVLAETAETQPLSVVVRGGIPNRGSVRAALYDSEAAFLTEPVRRVVAPVGADGAALVDFGPLPPGTYAVAVIYDRNGNGALDRNFLGIPEEPFGFSSGAVPGFGPPSFADAGFDHAASVQQIEIELQRAGGDRPAHKGS